MELLQASSPIFPPVLSEPLPVVSAYLCIIVGGAGLQISRNAAFAISAGSAHTFKEGHGVLASRTHKLTGPQQFKKTKTEQCVQWFQTFKPLSSEMEVLKNCAQGQNPAWQWPSMKETGAYQKMSGVAI